MTAHININIYMGSHGNYIDTENEKYRQIKLELILLCKDFLISFLYHSDNYNHNV